MQLTAATTTRIRNCCVGLCLAQQPQSKKKEYEKLTIVLAPTGFIVYAGANRMSQERVRICSLSDLKMGQVPPTVLSRYFNDFFFFHQPYHTEKGTSLFRRSVNELILGGFAHCLPAVCSVAHCLQIASKYRFSAPRTT